jgi:uncharacterized membrane protein YeiH
MLGKNADAFLSWMLSFTIAMSIMPRKAAYDSDCGEMPRIRSLILTVKNKSGTCYRRRALLSGMRRRHLYCRLRDLRLGVIWQKNNIPLMPPWIEYSACAVCAISGVLAAEGKRIDLFGVLVLALVTAVGGGTIRDICLDTQVFWLRNPGTILASTLAALFAFLAVRYIRMPSRALLIADAFGLAMFGIVGTEKALILGASKVTAVLLGIVTGVAGGVLRDVLRSEIPWVFRAEVHLYATTVFVGSVVFVLLTHWYPHNESNRFIGMLVILLLRLLAMHFGLRLPAFRMREH